MKTNNRPKFMGGLGEKKFCGTYRREHKVYDSRNIACTITTDGTKPLYLIKTNALK